MDENDRSNELCGCIIVCIAIAIASYLFGAYSYREV